MAPPSVRQAFTEKIRARPRIPASPVHVLLLAMALTGCGLQQPPSLQPGEAFPVGCVEIATSGDTVAIAVEVAATERLQQIGLSGRDSLAADAGMLFLFGEEQPAGSGFWMYATLLPLDVAFIDEAGSIVQVETMAPCSRRIAELCPKYRAATPYHAALEVNAGFFESEGIQPGAHVRWSIDESAAGSTNVCR